MKKTIVLSVLSAAALCGYAEDILQIVPQRIEKGSTSADERTFSIELVNESEFCALQFDLYLPDGMDFDDLDPIVKSQDRFPYTVGRGGAITFDHTVDYSKRPEGFYRVLVGFSSADKVTSKIAGNSGVLFTIYYVTTEDLPDGVLPIKIDNVTFAISGTEGIYPPASSGFFYTGDFDPSTVSALDLSGLTDYMPAGVVTATNDLISANTDITEVRLDNISDMGEKIAPSNPNCLVYMAENSDAIAKGVESGNVVSISDEGNNSTRIAIADGYDFSYSSAIACTDVNYTRDNISEADDFITAILPFEVDASEGIYQYVDCDGQNVYFSSAVGRIPAYTPLVVNVESLTDITIAGQNLQPLSPNGTFNLTDAASSQNGMKYGFVTKRQEGVSLNDNDEIAGCNVYGYSVKSHRFVRATNTFNISPFRAFFTLPKTMQANVNGYGAPTSAPSSLNIIIDGKTISDTSAIDSIITDCDITDTPSYNVLGIPVGSDYHGIVIRNGKKIINK